MSRRDYKSFEKILKDFLTNGLDNSFDFEAPIKDEIKRPHKLRPDFDFIVFTNYLFSNKKTKTKWEATMSSKEELERKLNESINNQNFEEAIKLRDQIKDLGKNNSKINELKQELELVVQEQNFERAIEIRDELKRIN